MRAIKNIAETVLATRGENVVLRTWCRLGVLDQDFLNLPKLAHSLEKASPPLGASVCLAVAARRHLLPPR